MRHMGGMPASTKTATLPRAAMLSKKAIISWKCITALQDIPQEHKVFSFPKLSIREQMAAYQEIIDGSSLEGYRIMPKKDRGDR